MEIGTVKISVDTTEIDNATKKLTELSQLLDKVQGQLDALSGEKAVNINYQVSTIDPEILREMFTADYLTAKMRKVITKSTLR